MQRYLVLGLSALALVGCVVPVGDGRADGGIFRDGGLGDVFRPVSDRRNDDSLSFSCDDDRAFTVQLDRRGERAVVDTDGRDYDLSLDGRSGDTYRYTGRRDGDNIGLSINRDRAELQIQNGADFKNCERDNGGFLSGRRDDRGRDSLDGQRVSFACDRDRDFLAQFSRSGDEVRISADGQNYGLKLADQSRRSRLYRGRENGDDLTFALERGEGYFHIEHGRAYENCRTRN